MTLTQYGWCPRCDARRELVMTSAGVLACHSCGSLNVYDTREAMEEARHA